MNIKRGVLAKITTIKSPFKLVLIDIDGTLTKDSKTISPKVEELIKQIKKKIMVSLISSRSRNSAHKFIKQLNLSSYHILENGAVIINPNFKPIYKICLQKEILKKLYKLIADNNLILNVCINGTTQYFDKVEKFHSLPLYQVTRISIINLKRSQLIQIEKLLKIIHKINYFRVSDKSITSSWNIDITSNLASKEIALKFLCKLMNIGKSQIIGIGDGYNDVPFIKNVSLKIAMGNAVKELKTIADIVVPPVNKDGLAHALEMIYTQLLKNYEK
ncbi:hypothetical protein A3B42_04705 [Candidatus Daviesbacteria bacterium RIFCSPLOWO2_01_FULL_38_10]|nr:MAG: hypothetical protein A2772_01275 [Candidatus Daviesbacteria bacterium RIFCSPHIGHO2_01_FULL_38_8b]OGE38465.1 MAG: hypothetical protein A3B42_04705 [Candidatus Daviesbacteria bacterium RIFCSPLOWO2_01_FULL_38_10]OGE68929.1 MAG: hypothetical protein A3H81_03415 [Candidatus Daviesbacteria bacterium RIFCSPLOWO2_02_FULL_38_18]OGE73155.1 MAG: hypothetical protein A3H18_05295 [Candidatus Daviesbacteria bacterium RIFCSPLOWO2_12_FULL_38_10]HAB52076.1 hypothetical protein [Ignavibacteriales bacteri